VIDQDGRPQAKRQCFALLRNRHRNFAHKRNAGLRQFAGQAFAIDGFEKPRPNGLMYVNRRANDVVGKFAMDQYIGPPWISVVLRVLRDKPYERMNRHGPFRDGTPQRPASH
jgi:hypothetical protein